MKTKTFDLHIISAAALSVISSAVVYLPTAKDKSPVLAMAFAILIGLPLYIFLLKLINKADVKNGIVKKILGAIISIFLIYLSAKSFHSVADYFHTAVLPKTPVYLILTTLFLLVFYAAVCGGDAVKKFTVIGFVSVAALIVILIIVSFKNLDLSLVSKPRFNMPFFETVAKYMVVVFVFSSEVLAFQRKGGSDKDFLKSTVLGVLLGGILLVIIIANSVLVFGENYSAQIKFPYSYAVSTFSIGTLFTRLDGFAYFIVLMANFLKGALCVLSCEYILLPFKIKHRKTLLFTVCAASLLLSLAL